MMGVIRINATFPFQNETARCQVLEFLVLADR